MPCLWRQRGGRLVDNQAHLTRLLRSCREVQLTLSPSLEVITHIQQELLLRNELQEGSLYSYNFV